MKRRKVLPAIAAAIPACANPAFPMGGSQSPNQPVHHKEIKELGEILKIPHRVHGFRVNWNDWFYFRSNAGEFNAYLKKYAQLKETPHMLIFHEEAGMTGGLETKRTVREIEIRNGSWVETIEGKGD